jgi:hypothetical protein
VGRIVKKQQARSGNVTVTPKTCAVVIHAL